jgi:nickel/cobalt exporter
LLEAIGEAWIVLLALGIGAAHMLAPDHWVPLTVYCHSRQFSSQRSAILAAAGGMAHVAGSVIAMAAAVAVGYAVVTNFAGLTQQVVGASFLAVGLYMMYTGFRAGSGESQANASKTTKWLVLATASSPELTIFPIYLAASVYGAWGIALSMGAFTVGTVASVVFATLAAIHGMGRFLRKPGRSRQIDLAVAATLLLLGAIVIASG